MVKIAITGRQNIRMPNGKLHDDAGLSKHWMESLQRNIM